ncbi:MAG: ISNCY family transposase [Deltaproteobacteria bacterium]|nr:ISNCY family transposase [Deltaproteobacteria bacterium]
MKRTELLQEVRKVRFEEVLKIWTERSITQEEAAQILGVSDRTFRRYIDRYKEEGLEGLLDKRLTQASSRRAPVDEVMDLTSQYKSRYRGWNVKHFYSFYKKGGGIRSYSWVKNELQSARLVPKVKKKGVHRRRREPSPLPGMMLHQDGSSHEWVAGKMWDLIVTMDDATNEHYSMFFVEEEGTASSFRGVRDVIEKHGLFSSFYSDRGSHYWITPEAGGKVDKDNLTQFGRAMRQLGIDMIPAYSPEARGRSERVFKTHQDRLVKELALNNITTMEESNRYIKDVYLPAYNKELIRPASLQGNAFVPMVGINLNEILCEQYERKVGADNCVHFEKKQLQIPKDKYRFHYVKAKVRVHRYSDGSLAVFHGPRKLSVYNCEGQLKKIKKAA